MNRHAGFHVAAALAASLATAGAASAQGVQVSTVQPPAAQAPAQAGQPPFIVQNENAQETREQLRDLLRQLPPAVGEVLVRDPSLAQTDYLAPYPALVSFLQQHPEIARNPSFFFGSYTYRDEPPRDRSAEMFRQVIDMFQTIVIGGALLGAFLWLIRTALDQRRWLRVSRTQAEVHTKLLDRVSNNEELLAYIQSPAGRRFLETGPVLSEGEAPRPSAAAPLSRIIWSLQAGVVLASLGIGFWVAQSRFPDDMAEGFFVIGTLATALGVGFAASGLLAYLISSRFGLVSPPAAVRHE